MRGPELVPVPGSMAAVVLGLDALAGGSLSLNVPEAVGDGDRPEWFHTLSPIWRQEDQGRWVAVADKPGELAYELSINLRDDGFELDLWLENRSERHWRHAAAFPCVLIEAAGAFRDHEGRRTWVSADGQATTIDRLPRTWSVRPGVQVYRCGNGPPIDEVALASSFGATSPAVTGPWMGLVDVADERALVVRSEQAGFLFHNFEYSCIHSCPVSGPMSPGEAWATTASVLLTSPERMRAVVD